MRATLSGMCTSFRGTYMPLPDMRAVLSVIRTAFPVRCTAFPATYTALPLMCTALPDTYTALPDVHMPLRGVYTLLSDAYIALCTQCLRTAATGRPEGLHYISMRKTKPLLPI
jgi:hypothetical protein